MINFDKNSFLSKLLTFNPYLRFRIDNSFFMTQIFSFFKNVEIVKVGDVVEVVNRRIVISADQSGEGFVAMSFEGGFNLLEGEVAGSAICFVDGLEIIVCVVVSDCIHDPALACFVVHLNQNQNFGRRQF